MFQKRTETQEAQVSIEVCASTLRLAYLTADEHSSGKRLVYKSVQWRQDAKSLLTEEGVEEFRVALHSLVMSERLMYRSVRIVLNGDLCVTRVVRGIADEVRHELSELEERSQRYLSLGPGTKASAVCQHQVDARHHHALISVANLGLLESLVESAKSVHLKVVEIEPSLVAISRLVGMLKYDAEEPCAIMFFNEQGVEFGISYRGLLLLDYHPGGKSARDGVSAIVSLHWSRLQRYCAKHFRQSGFELTNLFIGGDAQEVESVLEGFDDNSHIKARSLAVNQQRLPWSIDSEELPSDFSVAVGACVSEADAEGILPGPNLLDYLHQKTPVSLRPLVLLVGIPLAATLLIAVTLLGLTFRVGALHANLQSKIDQHQTKVVQAFEYRSDIRRAMTRLKYLEQIEASTERPDWNSLIKLVSQTMPEDVWLDKLDYRGPEKLTLVGASYDEDGVYEFVRSLEDSELASEVTLEGTRPTQFNSGPVTEFELEFKFNDKAITSIQDSSNE